MYIIKLYKKIFKSCRRLFKLVFPTKIKSVDLLTAEEIFNENTTTEVCPNCTFKSICQVKKENEKDCRYNKPMENFNFKKDTILIVDDNPGMVSFLKDDMRFLDEVGVIKLDKLNILSISGSDSAFIYKHLNEKYENLNIKWAIIDITLGGSQQRESGIVKYTGVDIFELLYDKNPDVNFLFYTGNNLNPYIKTNKKIIDQFWNITQRNIKDFVLFKTSMDMDKRRNFFKWQLFRG
ncbi:MAG: hypothetical protein KAI79_13660 [Bacteroidales bacterium]|nr:hypothetical protein [Bacteroidales bacterium]